jgi:hypothetical protein
MRLLGGIEVRTLGDPSEDWRPIAIQFDNCATTGHQMELETYQKWRSNEKMWKFCDMVGEQTM